MLSSVLACSGAAPSPNFDKADRMQARAPGSPGGGSSGSSSGIVGTFGDGGGAPDATVALDAGCATAQAQATTRPRVHALRSRWIRQYVDGQQVDRCGHAALQSIFSDINKSADTGEGADLHRPSPT